MSPSNVLRPTASDGWSVGQVRDMRQLHCVSHLHYGSIGFTGYDPSIWRLCGWSWQPRGNNYRKERCARKGAHPPFPFMNGAMELLSAPLVRYVAHSPEVAGFVSRAQQVPLKMRSAVRTLPSRLPIPLPLARQLAHQRPSSPGPLVLRRSPLSTLTPSPEMSGDGTELPHKC